MLRERRRVLILQLIAALAIMQGVERSTSAERLPIKNYTTADGLAHNVVNRVVRDSRGFLWFCTREGLSRFDGYSFTNYGTEQGLPSAIVNDLLETREGQYWVGTAGGLCRFDPMGRPQARGDNSGKSHNAPDAMFTVYSLAEDDRSRHVLSLLQDRAGSIWCGTRNGLYRVEAADNGLRIAAVDLGIPDYLESGFIECLIEDRSGALWIGSPSGLHRRRPDGYVEAYNTRAGSPNSRIQSLFEDREGRIWVGTTAGELCRLVSEPTPGHAVVARAYTGKDGLPASWISYLFQASDGTLWAGSSKGLIQFIPTADGRDFRFRLYGEAEGLSYHEVGSLAEDNNGNLWLGMRNGGAAKLARNSFTTFGKADGFSSAAAIFETRAGELIVCTTPRDRESFMNRFDGEKFIHIRPQSFGRVDKYYYGWGWNQTVVEDHIGEWWVATGIGVCRFPKVSQPEQLAHTRPKAVYTTRDGLAADSILRLFEDSRGDIWISSVGEGKGPNGLSRWDRRTGEFHHYSEQTGLPRLDTFYVSSFAEDRAGNLWIGFSGDGGLVRYRDQSFTLFTASDGVPAGQIRNLLIDSAGRLWVPSYRGGLSRIDNPSGEQQPTLVTYTTGEGLSSNEIAAVSEDRWGRIYIGTGRGLDRLDPTNGHIKHYTTADGLPLGEMQAAWRDRQGALWFSFSTGLARLVPQPDPPPAPPPIVITGLRIAGEAQVMSTVGETEMTLVTLGPDKNELQIDFVALGFSPGEGLRYQYRLEGAGTDWSALADSRTVNFANLSPGRYRFLVRAMNSEGVLSETPASLAFTILSPIWQRWWFVSLAAVAALLMVYSIYRYQLAQRIRIERVRTRIAADLHDDIGANLTTIAVLSEVVRQQIDGAAGIVEAPLSAIAELSRESVSSMSDIVWAINPNKDSLRDLTRRMRGFAADTFTSRDIALEFQPPVVDLDLKLEADVRRTVYLIFKEAVNNVARHSACGKAKIDIHVKDARLVLKIADDGNGFDAAIAADGNGLASMERRAKDCGGELTVFSDPAHGTTITLQIPTHSKAGKPQRG
jgi:ligand-binding sensor domain-containing protein/signal transduction histidine kinase